MGSETILASNIDVSHVVIIMMIMAITSVINSPSVGTAETILAIPLDPV